MWAGEASGLERDSLMSARTAALPLERSKRRPSHNNGFASWSTGRDTPNVNQKDDVRYAHVKRRSWSRMIQKEKNGRFPETQWKKATE
jgi:hypothetical protein